MLHVSVWGGLEFVCGAKHTTAPCGDGIGVTFLPLRLCYEKTRRPTWFSKDAENLTTHGYVLWCSQIVYRLFAPILWTLQSHFALWLSDQNLQCLFDWWRVMPQCIHILPRLDQFRNWLPTPQWCCNKCYGLANTSANSVSVTLWFCFQRSCKKCLQHYDSAGSNAL